MEDNHLDRLLAGISAYQDIVLAGQVVRRGERDPAHRWALIEPHLPTRGIVLDVGSNFGWFGWRAASTHPGLLVVSAESDERSARVQRLMLEANDAHRVLLVTRRADAGLVARCTANESPFAAVFCLSVLHWMPDHRPFLESLATRAKRIFLEYPDPREQQVGSQRIRDEIGDFESYLQAIFPQHQRRCLGSAPGLASSDHPRSIWLVEAECSPREADSPARLDAEAVLRSGLAWPNRQWWQANVLRCQELSRSQAARHDATKGENAGAVWITPEGLALETGHASRAALARVARYVTRLPESELFTRGERWRRQSRRVGRAMLGPLRTMGRRLSFSR
ncbi:MAG: hypothetical protein KF708_13950 [Pirellulales bacterium]|nr:hypothetical protein [Pirellulales bacterium]